MSMSAKPATQSPYVTCLAVLLFLNIGGGCAVFGAARQSEYVKRLQPGMMPSEVLQLAGEPQQKENLTGSQGALEIWDYLIYEGGHWKFFPVGFEEGRLAWVGETAAEQARAVEAQAERPKLQPQPPKTGMESSKIEAVSPVTEPVTAQVQSEKTATERLRTDEALHDVYAAAFQQGYWKGEQQRDAAWNEALARLLPDGMRETKQREAQAFVAGHEAGAGEEQMKREMQRGWNTYLAGQSQR